MGGGGGDEGRVSHIDRRGGSVRESSGGEGEHDPLPSSQNFQSCLHKLCLALTCEENVYQVQVAAGLAQVNIFFAFLPRKKHTFFWTLPKLGGPLPKSILTLFDFDTFLKVKKSPKLCAGGRG